MLPAQSGGGQNHAEPFHTSASSFGQRSRRACSDQAIADLAPVIAELRAAGVTSLRGIAAALNRRGIPTTAVAATANSRTVQRRSQGSRLRGRARTHCGRERPLPRLRDHACLSRAKWDRSQQNAREGHPRTRGRDRAAGCGVDPSSGARVIEHIARIRVHLPTSCPEGALFRTVALGLLRSGP
jgi:hypothetical protein